jgi:hypothetical protein
VNILQNNENQYSTLNQAIEAISLVLKDVANDKKLQKLLQNHVEQHGANEITHI